MGAPAARAGGAPPRARTTTLLACCAVLMCAAVGLRAAHSRAAQDGGGAAALGLLHGPAAGAAAGAAPSFAIVVVTAARSTDYLAATLRSLSCALSTPPLPTGANASGAPADGAGADEQPQQSSPVLVVNVELPASRHAAFTALQRQLQDEATNGTGAARLPWQPLTLPGLHAELRSEEFVLRMAARAAQDAELARAEDARERAALLAGLADTDRDDAARLFWRTKEALDAAFALEAAAVAVRGAPQPHVVFLQDDVRLAGGFLATVSRFLQQRRPPGDVPDVDVLTLFSTRAPTDAALQRRITDPSADHFGCVAVVLRAQLVPDLAAHLRRRCAEAPVDWLLYEFIRERRLNTWALQPDLAQHEGRRSSLPGKLQPLRSPSFADGRC